MNVDKFRTGLRVPAEGAVSVEVAADPYRDINELKARFNCISCYKILEWTGVHNCYECAECGIEMTAQEAVDLCDKYINLVTELARSSGKKKTFWQRMFK